MPPKVAEGRQMQKKLIRLASSLILLVLFFTISARPAFAAEAKTAASERSAVKTPLSVSGIKNKTLSAYSPLTLYINGKNAGFYGRLIGGEPYIPMRKAMESLSGAVVTYNSASRTLTAKGAGHNISVSDGAYVLYASDRPLFSMTPSVVLSDGAMYVPISSLSKALGLRFSYGSSASIHFYGTVAPLRSAESFYREDEVYWLSRIINAESRGESLLGQIAVGGVVLNRVRSPLYPNTIWSVIFDRKYGVQFSPVLDGSIHNTPGYTSVLAAKICLEGFSLSENSLFFLYPAASSSSWIPNNRTYEFSIGKHDFYA